MAKANFRLTQVPISAKVLVNIIIVDQDHSIQEAAEMFWLTIWKLTCGHLHVQSVGFGPVFQFVSSFFRCNRR